MVLLGRVSPKAAGQIQPAAEMYNLVETFTIFSIVFHSVYDIIEA